MTEERPLERIIQLIATAVAIVLILSLHEFAHAFVAYKCGDPTAKWCGRMTINPLKHLDPLGAVLFLLVGFGWAKPVPVNLYNLKNRKLGGFLVSIAGVTVNYLTAFAVFPLLILCEMYLAPNYSATYGYQLVFEFGYYLHWYSLCFCAFNLLPIYPLDGFRAIEAFDEKEGKVLRFFRRYGQYILLALVALGFIGDKLSALTANPIFQKIDVLGTVLNYVVKWIQFPIVKFWEIVF